VKEGAVGAGTGTVAFGWKGGIGTSSHGPLASPGGSTVGVPVRSNFGGSLRVHPVGVDVGRYVLREEIDRGDANGSIMIVVVTGAPLDSRNMALLASRALLGLVHTGSEHSRRIGDYVIVFSTAESVRRILEQRGAAQTLETLPNDRMSTFFPAAIEAAEAAILNSLCRATTTRGHWGTVGALPRNRFLELLRHR